MLRHAHPLRFAFLQIGVVLATLVTAHAAPVVTATLDDATPATTRRTQGSTITYTTTITNAGDTAAINVKLTDAAPAYTTEVVNSLSATPVALDDVYPQIVVANMGVNTAASGYSILSNDFLGYANGSPVVATALTLAVTDAPTHGAVTLVTTGSAIGQFSYMPAPGFTGSDSFTYTVNNGVGTSTATVRLTVASPVIWFVDTINGADTNNGTLGQPFKTLAKASTVDAANNKIFVYSGTYTGGITLKAGESLLGQSASAVSFDALMGITPGIDTPARPVLNTTKPVITGGNPAIALGVGNTVNSVAINNGSGAGITGNAIGATTISDITITTTSGAGLSVTTSGTLVITGAANTISTTTGTALSVQNVTIGIGGLTFKSISVNGASTGIVLANTGSTAGLTITGGGNASVGGDASGGTIQNTTGAGISLTSTSFVSLTNVSIHHTADSGIAGTGVAGFTLQNSKIDTSGNAGLESNVGLNGGISGDPSANNVSGLVTIASNLLTNGYYSGIDLQSGAGTVSNAVISNNTITSATADTQSLGSGININGVGTAGTVFTLVKATIANNTISNFPSGSGIQLNCGNANASGPAGSAGTPGDAANIVSIAGNSIHGTSQAVPMGANAIVVSLIGGSSSSRSRANVDISNNGTLGSPLGNVAGTAIGVGCNGNAEMTAMVTNNVIVANHTPNFLGSNGIGGGTGVAGTGNAWTPDLTMTVNGNAISQTDGNGILLVARGATGTAKFKVTNNVVGAPINLGGTARQGIRIDAGNNASADDVVALRISDNTSAGSNGASGIGIRKQGTVSSVNDFGLAGLTPSPATSAQAASYVAAQNPGAGVCDVINGDQFVSAALAPALLLSTHPQPVPASALPLAAVATSSVPVETPTVTAASAVLRPSATTPADLSQTDLDRVVAFALAEWRESGLDAAQQTRLQRLRFEVTGLTNLHLGEADGNVIRIDRTAGGRGWSVPQENEPDAVATDRLDLLSAVLHEMGHALGLPDTYATGDRGRVMFGWLAQGERRHPARAEAAGIVPDERVFTHFLSTPLSIGTLPAGKSVTVTFQVTVNSNLVAVGATQISNQGSVTGANFSTVSTDDPETGAANDATVTLVGVAPVVTTDPSPTTVLAGSTATFTAAATGIPAPTVQWQVSTDNGTSFGDVGGATSTTLTITTVSADSAKRFRAVFTNTMGTATTASATLTVHTPSTVTSVAVPANGTYKIGANLDFTVNWNEAVTVTGSPTLALTIGSASRTATYVSTSGTTTLFRYTVADGDTDSDGVALGGSISLTGGTIRNAASVDATLTLNSIGSLAGVLIDGISPRVASIGRQSPTISPTDADTLVFRVTFSKSVQNLDAADFTVTGTTATAGVATAGGNAYDVTITGGDLAMLNATVTLGFAAGQDIKDAVGNALSNTTPTGTNDRTFVVVNNVAPTFAGSTTTLALQKNAAAADVKSLLQASDTDVGQTLTWTQQTPPSHGTLTISGATAASGGTAITAGGTITYQPAAGYNGSDSFTVQVSDGITSATRTITATITAAPVAGFGSAMALERTASEVVQVMPNASLNFGAGSFTVEAWVQRSSTGTGLFTIVDKQAGAAGWFLRFTNNTLTFDAGGNSATGATTITDQAWHHVAAVLDATGKTTTLYLDGVQDGSATFTVAANTDSAAVLGLGGKPSVGDYFDGALDDVRLWSTARTAAQIREFMRTPLAGTDAGLAGYWTFEEGAGVLTADRRSSGHGNNGILVNAGGNEWVAGPANVYTATVMRDTSVAIRLGGSDVDDQATATAKIIAGPAHGALYQTNDGVTSSAAIVAPATLTDASGNPRRVLYVPEAGYMGTDSLTYVVNDGTADSANTVTFTFTVIPPAPTISSPLAAAGTYGTPLSTYTIAASEIPTSFSASGLPTGLAVSATTGAITGTPTASGIFNVTVSATNAGGTGTATVVFTIAKRSLTISGATAGNKAYDGGTTATLDTTAATLVGLISGDDVTLRTTGATGAFATASVGNAKPVTTSGFTIDGTASGNYLLTQPTVAANIIGKALSVTGVTAQNKPYDGTRTAVAAFAGASLVGVAPGDVVTLDTTNAAAAFSDRAVATGKTVTVSGLALTGADAGNYTVGTAPATADITPKSLTVTGVTGVDRVYDGTLAAVLNTGAGALVGLEAGDNVTLVSTGATGAFADKRVGAAKPVTSSGFALGGTDAGNYTLTQPTTTAAITAKALTIAGLVATPRSYDATTVVALNFTNAALVGVVATDTVGLVSTGASASIATSMADPAKPVTITGLTLSGADASNYTLTIPSLTVAIAKAAATVTLGNLGATYSGTPVSVSATTTPAGLPVSVSYSGSPSSPTAGGMYQVTATINDPNWAGTATGTLIISQATQTLSFAPSATATIGSPLTLSASASSQLPVSFSLVSGDATLVGSTLTLNAVGTAVVRATQPGNSNYTAVSADARVSATAKLSQTITFEPVASHRLGNTPFTLNATASSGLPVSYTIVSGPGILDGTTLTFTGAGGALVIRASQPGNGTYAAAPDVVRTIQIIAVGPQVFFGTTTNGDRLAAVVGPDGKGGTIIGYLTGTKEGFIVIFTLNSDGSFETPATVMAGTTASVALNGPVVAAAATTRTFRGQLVNGALTGSIAELGLSFTASAQPANGPSAAIAGFYQASSTNTASGNTYLVVGTQGNVLVLAETPNVLAAGTGTVAADNTFTVPSLTTATGSTASVTGSIDVVTTSITGSMPIQGKPAETFVGINTATTRTDRLVNLSSRARTGPNTGGTLITGFVIGGSSPKRVLLRAIGPALAGFGVSGALPNPRLILYRGDGQVEQTNDDWTGTDTAATFGSVGAFTLPANSRDAALVVTLTPGAYTMHVVDGGDTGIALAEIYDASMNPSGEYQRLINISTRGTVETGDGVLIGGFVITGNAPKRVLVRGVGPSLAGFGVPGTLADPRLALYRDSTLVAQNDDWGVPTAVDATQQPATSTEIARAATLTGAFSLASGTKDAAVVVTLAPGAYTAQVAGAGGTSGVALVEIYEIPE